MSSSRGKGKENENCSSRDQKGGGLLWTDLEVG